MTGPTVKVGQEKEMSAIYGAEHFLRMLGTYLGGSEDHCSDQASSELATDGRELVDGRGIGGVAEGLCERAAAVRVIESGARADADDTPTGGW